MAKTPYERLVHYLERQKRINMNSCLPLIRDLMCWCEDHGTGGSGNLEKVLKEIGLAQPPIYLEKYFYEAYYNDCDYEVGQEYMSKYKPAIGGCSSFRYGNYTARNYDWSYDERPEFVIHMAANAEKGRHASVGIAAAMAEITDELAYRAATKQDIQEDLINAYKITPFLTLDGINDAGFSCNINVTALGDCGKTTGTNPEADTAMCGLMLVRYLLDYADSVDHAIELINNLNIYNCYQGEAVQQEFHFMLSDKTKTVVVEFINNEVVVIDSNFLTNYHLYLEKQFNDGEITEAQFFDNHLMGYERAELIKKALADADENGFFGYFGDLSDTQAEMIAFAVYYLDCFNAYRPEVEPFWYSEYEANIEGVGDFKHNTPHEEMQDYINHCIDAFEVRERDGEIWQTVHTSSYDLSALESEEKEPTVLWVVPQASVKAGERQISTSYKFSIGGSNQEINENWAGGITINA